MGTELKKYKYRGSVKSFDKIINEDYYAETLAVSPKKAKSNFIYRYKIEHGLLPESKISLPGLVQEID